MKQKKVLILGASYSQLPLIIAAKRLGYKAVTASIPGPYAGFREADEILYADITRPEEVLRAAREAQVDAVTTCCMDVGILAQGYVCEHMHLPGPGYEAARAACDKSVEKAAYRRCGVSTADYELVHDEAELMDALARLRFPVILKAVDQMGSRGIYRCNTQEEALENFPRSMAMTKRDFCIVEEFLEGTMFGVEAMMSCGKLAYVLPLGNVMREGNPSFPVGHYVPWEHADEVQEKVREQVEKAALALGFDNCAMDLDCMYLDGEVYIIEATARAGATCITDTVSIYYGIDYYEAIVKAALGEDVSGMFRKDPSACMPSLSRLLGVPREGVIRSIHVPDQLPEEVYDLSFNIGQGSRVAPLTHGGCRVGQLIVRDLSLAKCSEILQNVLTGITYEYEEQE